MKCKSQHAIVRSAHERVNRGDIKVFDEVLAPDYARHCQAMPLEAQEIRSAEPLAVFVRENLAVFPDWNDNIDFMFAAETTRSPTLRRAQARRRVR